MLFSHYPTVNSISPEERGELSNVLSDLIDNRPLKKGIDVLTVLIPGQRIGV